jgi:alkanesulfonate monooxygenase SsuD/methylene tetrahydromethanopterin reductase-like flavin-dependent oxidoreductase (luciferase family)
VISGGRAILGIGAGWKEDEWLAYGYGFPPAGERLAVLADQLEIITRMLGPGRATFEGAHAHVRDAIHEPKGLQQPRIPILVGWQRTEGHVAAGGAFRRRAQPDALPPAQVEAALPVIAERCEEVGRDPATLAVSVHIWGEAGAVAPGAERRQRLRDYANLGLHRAIVQGFRRRQGPAAIDDVIDDALAVGLLGEAVSPA